METDEANERLARLRRGRLAGLRGPTQLEDLTVRLRDVTAWCSKRTEHESESAALRPGSEVPRPYSGNRWKAVDAAAQLRGNDVGGALGSVATSGRLLVYFPDANLADGAAEVASGGFFDVDNTPPWGTWVDYFEDNAGDPSYSSYVLCWVPRPFMAAANAGISVNPEECIRWLEDSDVDLRQILPLVGPWQAG